MIVDKHDVQTRWRISLLNKARQAPADIDGFIARRDDHGDLRRRVRCFGAF
jgi:hypothetical protein